MRTLILSLLISTGLSTLALAAPPPQTQSSDAAISYQGFMELSKEVQQYRKDRLVSTASFFEMAKDPNTIILDTRSKAAFDLGHIKGAVHLNFSDFTDEKLAKTIGSKDRRILIYCNNNFTDNVRPLLLKRVELALNVPTFINLYGYGYKNVYELKDAVSIHDPEIQFVETERRPLAFDIHE